MIEDYFEFKLFMELAAMFLVGGFLLFILIVMFIGDFKNKKTKEVNKMNKKLDYNELFAFVKEFGIDYVNCFDELIIDEKTNTYTNFDETLTMEEVKTRVVYSLARPISKELKEKDSERLLLKLNNYFNSNLTKQDMRLIYVELCYPNKIKEFTEFIKKGFPMDQLKEGD